MSSRRGERVGGGLSRSAACSTSKRTRAETAAWASQRLRTASTLKLAMSVPAPTPFSSVGKMGWGPAPNPPPPAEADDFCAATDGAVASSGG